jgi:NAD(P)-dependent dehydrogenase (short-subunit alcohol dehydrogenase family)
MAANLFDVSEKVVIVTGASRGIGRAVAEGFLDHGARVVLSARSESLTDQVAAYDAESALAVRADMADPDAGQTVVEKTLEKFGRVDVLINNAAITLPGAPPYDDATWNTTLDVNLSGAFRMARAAATAIAETGGGSIIHIASIAGIVAMPGNPSYSAAKAGLRHLSKAMANDFATRDVRINTICPGYIVTDMTRASFLDPQRQAERSARTMMGRWGQPEELLGPCLFLASDASSYVTGIDLIVDGGWTGKGM